jgi:3-hydroxyisobutyryl-CoA hydrolase
MQLGRSWSISETFQREHQIAAKFMRHPDFTEGVHALLIRKDGKPQWQPATLEDIKRGDNIADPFFEVEGEERLALLSNSDFKEYPWYRFGIPREQDVKDIWLKGGQSTKRVADIFVEQRHGKQGVKEVVSEILKRKARKDDGKATWID